MTRISTTGHYWVTREDLLANRFGRRVPEMEKFRNYWGKAINSALIETALQNAAQGYLRDLCDIGYEVLRADPHLAAIVQKRLSAVASVTPRVTPATGIDVDSKLAAEVADLVRWQLERIPRLKQRLKNLAASAWYGRAALEIEWVETRDPKQPFRAANLHWIHSRRLCLGPERELRVNDGLWQGTGFEKIGFDLREIPFKFITSQRQLFSEYNEREGLLPHCLYYSYFKRFSWRERLALMELYGKPLRWVELNEAVLPSAGDDVIDKAKDYADDIGSDTAGALPPGHSMKVQSLAPGANSISKEIADDCNKELSKLVLGSTNTTDAQPSGLGSEQARVHQDGEILVFTGDCDEIAEDLTHGLARAIVTLNYGPDVAALYTPKIELPFELPPNRETELGLAKTMLEMKLPLKVEEIYERGGFTRPAAQDEIISELPAPAGGGGPFDGLFRGSVTPSDTSNQEHELEPKRAAPAASTPAPAQRATFRHWRRGRVKLSGGALEERFVQGIPVHIDRPMGFVQTGMDPTGAAWSRTYLVDYGFIPRTAGGDGEGLDVFLGPVPLAPNVYWVKQTKPAASGAAEFDEYKLFVGFESAAAALDCYADHVPTKFFGGLEQTTVEQVKALLGIEPKVTLTAGDDLALERAARVLGLIGMLGDEVRGS